MNKQFLTIKLLSFFIGFLCSISSWSESIGKVIASKGECYAVLANHKFPVKRGDSIERNEKFITGSNGFLQLRFIDKSITALRPNSEFQIEQYNLGDTNHKTGEFQARLIKGQFRQLTGSIAKKNPRHYKIKTPLSSVGVRGTYFGYRTIEAGNNIYEFSGCWRGQALLTTSHAWLSIGSNALFTYGYVNAENLTPIGLIDEPDFLEGLIPSLGARLDDFSQETMDFQYAVNDSVNKGADFEDSVARFEDIDIITDMQQLLELQALSEGEEPFPGPLVPPIIPIPPEPPVT